MAKTKLELTWLDQDKDSRPKLEPRILLEGTSTSYRAPNRLTEYDIFDNSLISHDAIDESKALAGLAATWGFHG